MTDTVTRVVYSDYFVSDRSSVIESVFYVDGDEELYVVLHTGVVCGYADVPREVFKNFKLTEDTGGSVGAYWNRFIKDHFTGISTEVIELLSEEEAADNDTADYALTHAYVDSAPNGFWTSTSVNTLPSYTSVQPVTRSSFDEFVFAFEADGRNEGELSLMAADELDAVRRFNQIVDIAGWEGVKIGLVAHIFS